MTESFEKLREAIMKSVDNEDQGCVDYIVSTIEQFTRLFSSVETLKKKSSEYYNKTGINPVPKMKKILHELRKSYFESLAPHLLSFRMIASDLGTVLNELK